MSALAFDRQAIEKKDFPISRRGYEPEAVDAHLGALADEVERLESELVRAQRTAAGAPAPVGVQSLAVEASEQVMLIVRAAESSAAEIERSAEEQAARIRADADAEARRVRDEAVQRSEEHVGQVSGTTSGMLERVDSMESELGALFQSLRTGANRLTSDLSSLQGSLGELHGSAATTGAAAAPELAPDPPAPVQAVYEPPEPDAGAFAEPPEPPAAAEPFGYAPPDDAEPEAFADADDGAARFEEPAPPVPVSADDYADEPAAAAQDAGAPEGSQDEGDVEGARLIALNMALNGQSRDETDQYLRDNFDLADRATLLDEVYATVEG